MAATGSNTISDNISYSALKNLTDLENQKCITDYPIPVMW